MGSFLGKTLANMRLARRSTAMNALDATELLLLALGALLAAFELGWPALGFIGGYMLLNAVLVLFAARDASRIIAERLDALPPGWADYLAGKCPNPPAASVTASLAAVLDEDAIGKVLLFDGRPFEIRSLQR